MLLACTIAQLGITLITVLHVYFFVPLPGSSGWIAGVGLGWLGNSSAVSMSSGPLGMVGLVGPCLDFLFLFRFFSLPVLSISMLTLLFLFVYPVSLSYFLLAVPMSSSGRKLLHELRTTCINTEWYLLFCFGLIFAFQKLNNNNNNNSNTAYYFYFNCSSELYF